MNKRVQLFFSWWLCVIAAWIYLLCAGDVSGIGPVLSFLSHQDLAQQQSYPDKVYKKGCERSRKLPERVFTCTLSSEYLIRERSMTSLSQAVYMAGILQANEFSLYFSVRMPTGNSLLILALAQALLLPLLPCLCSHTLFPTFSSIFWPEFDLEQITGSLAQPLLYQIQPLTLG